MDGGQNIYEVPDNFACAGRVFKGLFETRAFAEACVLGGAGALLALLLPLRAADARVCAVILCAGPGFALGILGIRGEPVSAALADILRYLRTRRIMLYDGSARALEEAPVRKMDESFSAAERVRLFVDRKKDERLRRLLRQSYVYGETYTFATDTDAAREYVDTEDFGLPLGGEGYVFTDAEPEPPGVAVPDGAAVSDFPYIPNIPLDGAKGARNGTD